MANFNKSSASKPVDSEKEVILITDSEDEDLPVFTKPPEKCNNIPKGDSDPTQETSESNSADVYGDVLQLINWVNSCHEAEENAPGCSKNAGQGTKKKFMNGYRFIEGIQSEFEKTQKDNAEKEEHIAEIVGENEMMRNQLKSLQKELDKLKRRNVKLEEYRRQRKCETLSLPQIRSKVASLQTFFGTVITKIEKEPVNPLDFEAVRKRKEVDEFKSDVNQMFNKVLYKLRKWNKNQTDMEAELESTRKVLERLNQMVLVAEKFRANADTVSPAVAETPARAPSVEILEQNPQAPSPVSHQAGGIKRKLPPPPLLPLASLQMSSTSSGPSPRTPSSSPRTPNDENNMMSMSSVPSPNQFAQQQQKGMDSLLTSLAALQPIRPKPSEVICTEPQLRSIPSYSLNRSNELPLLTTFNVPISSSSLTSVASTSVIRSGPSFSGPMKNRLIAPKVAFNKSSTITSSSVFSQSQAMMPVMPALSNLVQSPSSENVWSTTTAAPFSQPLLYHPPAAKASPAMNPFKTPANLAPRSNRINTGSKFIPLQLPMLHTIALPQAKELPVPVVHQREAIEILGGPSTSPQARPSGGQNICGLCGMSFNTLIQLKLHHTVVHAKGPLPGTSIQTPGQLGALRPIGSQPVTHPVRRNALILERNPPIQAATTVTDTAEPVPKRFCLGQLNPSLSSSSSNVPVQRSVENSPQPAAFGRPSATEANNSNVNATSNENSVYPFL